MGELVEVDAGYELAAERVLGVHRIRLDRVSDVSELIEELGGDEAGPSEVVVSELLEACGPPERPASAGDDRLSDHLTPVDPGLDSVIPNAVVTGSLEEALAAFVRKPGVYVTRDGASVALPGIVRFGRGGPGEGFLSTRREVAELEAGEEEGTRRLAGLARSRTAAVQTADEAGRAVEELRGAAGRAENLVVRLRLESAHHQETVENVRKRIEELSAEVRAIPRNWSATRKTTRERRRIWPVTRSGSGRRPASWLSARRHTRLSGASSSSASSGGATRTVS